MQVSSAGAVIVSTGCERHPGASRPAHVNPADVTYRGRRPRIWWIRRGHRLCPADRHQAPPWLAGRAPAQDATVQAINTSGHAVLFAGSTVCIALLGILARV